MRSCQLRCGCVNPRASIRIDAEEARRVVCCRESSPHLPMALAHTPQGLFARPAPLPLGRGPFEAPSSSLKTGPFRCRSSNGKREGGPEAQELAQARTAPLSPKLGGREPLRRRLLLLGASSPLLFLSPSLAGPSSFPFDPSLAQSQAAIAAEAPAAEVAGAAQDGESQGASPSPTPKKKRRDVDEDRGPQIIRCAAGAPRACLRPLAELS